MSDPLDALAEALHAARRDDSRVPPPDALSADDARAVQVRLDALETSPVVGFKIGATTAATLELLGLDGPFVGTLHAEHHRTGDGELRLPRALPVRVECEIVLRVGRDVTLGADDSPPGAVDPERVRRAADAVDAAFAGLEFVGTRFELDLPGNGAALIADGGSAVATVLSDAPVKVSPAALGDLEIRLDVDGERRASGRPSDSLAGDPFGMLAWLLGRPAFAERGLRAGELVYCGTCTGAVVVAPGERLVADFGALGTVRTALV